VPIRKAFNVEPKYVYRGKTDYLFVFENENQLKTIIPDLNIISSLGGRGTIVTARGDKLDFVSRFFAPQSGINEDPITGSAHTSLVPYWSKELKKEVFSAAQLSDRGGYLQCRYQNGRIKISGECKLYMKGHIYLE